MPQDAAGAGKPLRLIQTLIDTQHFGKHLRGIGMDEKGAGESSRDHLNDMLDGGAKLLKGVANLSVHAVNRIRLDVMAIARIIARVMSDAPMHTNRLKSMSAKMALIWSQLSRRESIVLAAVPLTLVSAMAVAAWQNESSAVAEAEKVEQPYVKAGGFLCKQSFQVMGNRPLRNHPFASFQGCERVGARMYVNVLREDPQFRAVLVGNSGGTAWVDPEDLAR